MTWKEEAAQKAADLLAKLPPGASQQKRATFLRQNNPYHAPEYKGPWRALVNELTDPSRTQRLRKASSPEEEAWLRKQGL